MLLELEEGWVVMMLVMAVTSWGWVDWINFWSVSSYLMYSEGVDIIYIYDVR